MRIPRKGYGRNGYISGSLTEIFPGHSDWDEVGTSAVWLDWSEREDIVAPRNDNGLYFRVDRWRVLSGFISGFGISPGGGTILQAQSYIPTRYSFGNGTAIQGLLPGTARRIPDNDLQYLYTGFVNSTNPGRSQTNLPVYLGELREVPSLIRAAKDLINLRRWRRAPLRALSNFHLLEQFGLKPLVSDVHTMLNLPGLINQRFNELRDIQRTGISRKTRRLWSSSDVTTKSGEWATTSPIIMPYDEKLHVVNTAWGHVNWIADHSFRNMPDNETRLTALNQLVDGNISINDLWELIPWTWLHDYFASTGDYLSYIGNRIPGIVDKGSVMCSTYQSLTATYVGPPLGDLQVPPVLLYHNGKYRIPGSPGAYATDLPVLSGGQMSNIAALIASSRARFARTA